MSARNDVSTFVVHYTPLFQRRVFLENAIVELEATWITENHFLRDELLFVQQSKVFGVSPRLIAADLGINSRSLSRSRRKAWIESIYLRYASFLGKRFYSTSFGSLPIMAKLPSPILDVTLMHFRAIKESVIKGKEWALILEDDAIPVSGFSQQVIQASTIKSKRPIWINLNAGACLNRTNSDPEPNQLGLFRVRPAATRCSTAYMINRSYARTVLELAKFHGIPNWLPIDIIFQVANRKMKAISYWSEPPTVLQGSESGYYKSNLESIRFSSN